MKLLSINQNPTRLDVVARAKARGMSLIEVIGALAIIAILASVAGVNAIRRIDEQRRQDEVAAMERIAKAFEQVVIHYKMLPSTNEASWAALVASEMGVPNDLVWTNAVGSARILVYDPGMVAGGVTPASFPWLQRAQGATNLINPRLVILSTLKAGYPNIAFTTSTNFNALWNRVEHQLPSGWPAEWSADPDDLLIERIDLSGLFHRVVLNNVDGWEPARYLVLTNSLSGTNFFASLPPPTVSSPPAPFATYLIHGTPIQLWYGPSQVVAGGNPQQVMDVINADASYAFEAGRWNRHPQDGLQGNITCGVLGQWVEQFMKRTDWLGANATTSEAVVLGMYDTLCGAYDWASAGVNNPSTVNFENENGNSKWEAPSARFIFDICPQLMIGSTSLLQ